MKEPTGIQVEAALRELVDANLQNADYGFFLEALEHAEGVSVRQDMLVHRIRLSNKKTSDLFEIGKIIVHIVTEYQRQLCDEDAYLLAKERANEA